MRWMTWRATSGRSYEAVELAVEVEAAGGAWPRPVTARRLGGSHEDDVRVKRAKVVQGSVAPGLEKAEHPQVAPRLHPRPRRAHPLHRPGPAMYYSPRHRMPFNSINEGHGCVG